MTPTFKLLFHLHSSLSLYIALRSGAILSEKC